MFKNIKVLVVAVLALGLVFTACKSDPRKETLNYDETNDVAAYRAFSEYTVNLQAAAGVAFKRVQEQLQLGAGQSAKPVLAPAFINNTLAGLRAQAPITSWCWQDAQGVIMYSDLDHTVGQKGGAQDIVNVALQNKAVYASNNVVARAENPRSLVIVIPVVEGDRPLGAYVGVVAPTKDFVELLSPFIDPPRGIVLMNLQGGVIFSDSIEEVGRNYLTDERYKPFGDLLLSVTKMRSQESGITRYYYFISNTPYKDWYTARWSSVNYFSHVWRIIFRLPTSLDLQTIY